MFRLNFAVVMLVRRVRRIAAGAMAVAVTAVSASAQPIFTPYAFTTLAGSAGRGTADGRGAAVEFDGPMAVAVAMDGTLFVADANNHTIRKVAPDGSVTTFAGAAGEPGSVDGTLATARFNRPTALAIDGEGTLHVADTDNHTIRAVTRAGLVRTVAGAAGVAGNADGRGSGARFSRPRGMALDAEGNLYVADAWNFSIRRVTRAGDVSTVAGPNSVPGTAPAIVFRFAYPTDVALDRAGNLLVADNGAVRRIAGSGAIETVVPSFTGRLEFQAESALAIDAAGNVYQSARHGLRVLAADGTLADFAGSATTSGSADGLRLTARFSSPRGLAVDAGGSVYVADTGNNTLRKITPAGIVATLAGRAGSAGDVDDVGRAARFNYPLAIAVDAQRRVFVADQGNWVIRRIEPDGTVVTFAGTPHRLGSADGPPGVAQFGTHGPYGVAVDAAGNVFVCDADNFTVRKITPAGVVSTFAGQAGASGSADGIGGAARFGRPVGIAIDADANLYVTDNGNHTIRRITPSAEVSTIAGVTGVAGMLNGRAAEARFNFPVGIAVDYAGNIFVADQQNHVIRKITAAGVVSTLAGTAGAFGNLDGRADRAQFWGPSGVAVDDRGTVFVTDSVNSTVRRITLDGMVTTLGGVPRAPGSRDGAGERARFSSPADIAVDADGTIYVADAINNTIRVGRPATTPTATARLSNISTRAVVGQGGGVTVAGFAISAAPGVTKRLLLRVVGPGLGSLGVEGTLSRPRLTLHDSRGRVIGSNEGWSERPGPGEPGAVGTIRAATPAAMLAVGAFALAPASEDAALIAELPSGTYTIVASSRDGGLGVALTEVYEMDTTDGALLRNISGRVQVSADAEVAIAGFIVTGDQPASLLVRGIGPTLAAFGVADALPRLKLTVFDAAGRAMAQNVAWGERVSAGDSTATFAIAPASSVAAQRVGAFALPAGSRDAALRVTLPAGGYTVVLSGEGEPIGSGLLEVYAEP